MKTPRQWTLPLPRLLVNCSSTAHLLPVQLKVVIINKMKNEPVREQFSHCAEVWARYPPQALRARDVKGRLWFRSSNRKTLHKPSNSLQSVLWKLQMSPRNPREGEERGRGWQHTLYHDALRWLWPGLRFSDGKLLAGLSCTVHLEKLQAPPNKQKPRLP